MMLITALVASAALAPPECDVSYKQQQQIAASTLSALEAEGWTHAAGKLAFTSGHHYGNNPQSVYGLIYSDIAGKGLLPLFGIGPADAVLWVGCTPPPLQYFSMRSYLTGWKMLNVFGSLGDAANNLRFNSSGGGTSPANFNRTAALIVSGDLGSGARVADALRTAGLPQNAVNHDWVPPSLLHLTRHNLVLESLMFLYRVTMFHDPAAGARYTNSSWPLLFLYAPDGTPKQPAPVPTQRPRGTGTNESALQPRLDALASSAATTVGGAGFSLARSLQLKPIDIEGILKCVPEHIECGGDNRDAAYFSDANEYFTLPKDGSSFLLVVGVDHNATGKATYGNLVVETAPPDQGVFNSTCDGVVGTDSRFFGGTAAPFAGGAAHAADQLYAVAVSRACKTLGPSLFPSAPASLHCLQVDDTMLAKRSTLRIVVRAYLEAATMTGPAYEELVWPKVLQFTKGSKAE